MEGEVWVDLRQERLAAMNVVENPAFSRTSGLNSARPVRRRLEAQAI
jgi:hypothetical protein